jgi:hypothetical protein
MNNFHLVDFVGWNTTFEVLAHYHTDDVKVFGNGFSTVGMEAHEAMLRQFMAQTPDAKIDQHFPNVAKGEWTGVVGLIMPENFKMATIAKWKEGRIAEEYLFFSMVPADAAAAMNPSDKSTVVFENADDKELADEVDLQPGWMCAMDVVNDKITAFFIKKVDGKEVERIVFQ